MNVNQLIEAIADGIRVFRVRDGIELSDAAVNERARNITQAVLYLQDEARTTVVNMRSEEHDVYIGRAGHGEVGTFGSPILAHKPCQECGKVHQTPASTLPCFRRYFYDRVYNDPRFLLQVAALKGKRLGCFCAPNPCHGDTIVEWLDGVDLR